MSGSGAPERCGKILSVMSVIFFAAMLVPFWQENDLGFLLSDGRYLWENGFAFPTEDPFTMHSGLHFVMQQWLAAAIFWKAYLWGGVEGVYALTVLTGVAILYAYYRLLMMASHDNRPFAVLMLLICGSLFSLIFLRMRPQIFSALLLLGAVLVLEKYRRTQNSRYLWWLPLISLLLINLHGALWPMLIVVMLPYLAASLPLPTVAKYFTLNDPALLRPLLYVLLPIIAVALVNPYGSEALFYGASSYDNDTLKDSVMELQPLTVRLDVGKIFLPLFALIVVLTQKRKLKLTYVLFSLGFMYMSLDGIRNLIFFILFGTLPLAEYFRGHELISFNNDKATEFAITPRQMLLFALLFAFIAFSFLSDANEIMKNFHSNMIPCRQVVMACFLLTVAAALYCGCRWQMKRAALAGNARRKLFGFGLGMFLLIGLATVSLGAALPPRNDCATADRGLSYIAEHDSRQNLPIWINCNLGSYAEFHGFRPYMDTRMELFFQKNNGKYDYFTEMQSLDNGTLYYRDFLAKYDFAYILTKQSDLLDTYLQKDSDYELLFEYEAAYGEKQGKKSTHFRLFKPKNASAVKN